MGRRELLATLAHVALFPCRWNGGEADVRAGNANQAPRSEGEDATGSLLGHSFAAPRAGGVDYRAPRRQALILSRMPRAITA